MDPKELRLGNFLIAGNAIGKVTSLNEYTVTVQHAFAMPWDELPPITTLTYNPIPLTPEWLERLGATPFKSYVLDREDWSLYVGEYESSRIMYGDGFVYCEVPDANMWCPFNIRQLNYVHQLQNLYFALTGEELTIKQPETK
jgi:hypothetical protein